MSDITDIYRLTRTELERRALIIGGAPWFAPDGSPRIYMRGPKSVKAFFSFPDWPSASPDDPPNLQSAVLGGATFHCHIDTLEQHPNWYKTQKAAYMAAHARAALALCVMIDGSDEAMALGQEIMDDDFNWSGNFALFDAIAHEAVNGRIVEARARYAARQ